MAKESTLKNMVLVLTLITCVAAALLAAVYGLTKEPIEQAGVNKVNAAIQDVLPEFDNNPFEEKMELPLEGAAAVQSILYRESAPESLTFYPAAKNGEPVGMAVETFTNQGFSGRITLMVGFLPDGTINKTSIISHSETPGLGDKIDASKSNFSKQFEGQNPATFKLIVKKDGGDIDAITASTITSRAFCDAMVRAYNAYILYKLE
ncbi:MAG: RnfABCDGE type electron transport complex subunit G [Prevotellaceae bacterium]|jgi:electron transport complex protein RnfG|nr:RnfABCDGE type electron transport complex subunit G [Prevotellaceae bacterium]